MIEVRGLSKSFDGFQALNNVNINVIPASVYGIVGPNGSGKTTLIKHMAGIFVPDQGTVRINGGGCLRQSGRKRENCLCTR